jgi:GPI-anchor transamidase subunit U
MLALALSSYLSLYPILLILPLILFSHDQQPTIKPKTIVQTSTIALSTFISAFAGLICLSYLLTGGSWEFISSTYGVQLLLPDLTPNVGLWWYFFIEMFDSFREFFLGVFWLHLAGYVGGLSVKLRCVSNTEDHRGMYISLR